MDNEQKAYIACVLAATVLTGVCHLKQKKKVRKTRRIWVKEIFKRRSEQGFYNNLIEEMIMYDQAAFFNFTRMGVSSFEFLLHLVAPHITKDSVRRESIPAACRLILTLRFLATGDSYKSLSYSFRISHSTICIIIKETCDVIWDILMPIYMNNPNEDGFKKMAREFYNSWQLLNCLGAIDGKHIHIHQPPNAGSLYYNYKKHNSIVLLGICNASYFFTFIDIGAYAAQSDGGILKLSQFGQKLNDGTLTSYISDILPNTNESAPTFFVDDEAFPLQSNLMRPFSGRGAGQMAEDEAIFNYRLSRARRTIENTFGILVARFRIFDGIINALPMTVDSIVKAATCLHNFIKCQNDSSQYCNADFVDREVEGVIIPGGWRNEVGPNAALQRIHNIRFGNRNASGDANRLRNNLKQYLNGEGSLVCPWQIDYIRRTH